MHVCVCVCVCVRLLITSGVICTPYDWLNKFNSFYMAAAVVIVSNLKLGLIALIRVIETNLMGVS